MEPENVIDSYDSAQKQSLREIVGAREDHADLKSRASDGVKIVATGSFYGMFGREVPFVYEISSQSDLRAMRERRKIIHVSFFEIPARFYVIDTLWVRGRGNRKLRITIEIKSQIIVEDSDGRNAVVDQFFQTVTHDAFIVWVFIEFFWDAAE